MLELNDDMGLIAMIASIDLLRAGVVYDVWCFVRGFGWIVVAGLLIFLVLRCVQFVRIIEGDDHWRFD